MKNDLINTFQTTIKTWSSTALNECMYDAARLVEMKYKRLFESGLVSLKSIKAFPLIRFGQLGQIEIMNWKFNGMHSESPECILSWLLIGFWKLNDLLLVFCESECVWNKLQIGESLKD